jgi:hypothetical protein
MKTASKSSARTGIILLSAFLAFLPIFVGPPKDEWWAIPLIILNGWGQGAILSYKISNLKKIESDKNNQ